MFTEDEERQLDRIAKAPPPTDQEYHLLLLRQNLEEAQGLAPAGSPILDAIGRGLDNLAYVEHIRAREKAGH